MSAPLSEAFALPNSIEQTTPEPTPICTRIPTSLTPSYTSLSLICTEFDTISAVHSTPFYGAVGKWDANEHIPGTSTIAKFQIEVESCEVSDSQERSAK